MAMHHVQAVLPPAEYAALQAAAQEEDLTLGDALRQAAMQWARQRGTFTDPLDALIAVVPRGPRNASAGVDDIYAGD